jgi:hypothetical protein
MVVLPAAATKTFATIDSTSDLVHLYIESSINAIGMRASRTVGAGAAKNSWGVCTETAEGVATRLRRRLAARVRNMVDMVVVGCYFR